MAQFTVHRALAKIKTTEKRFESLLDKGMFVSSTIGKTNISKSGRAIKDIETEIKANYDSAMALLSNFEALKLAIIRSNSGITAETSGIEEMEVCGKKMLVAEIIAKMKYVMPVRKKLIDALTLQYNVVTSDIERINSKVQSNLPNVLSGISNGTSNVLTEVQTDAITKTYYENNSCFIVDPMGLQGIIRKLQKEYDDFMDEADSKLSEANALKLITVAISE